MRMDLSIVIPVYNEQDNVELLRSKMDAYLGTVSIKTELVFVDDGSVDDSVERLCQKPFQNASVKIIKLSRNYGAHAAIRAGLQRATADICMIYFMDMQDPLEMIGDFYKKICEDYDIVYEDRVNYHQKASIASKIYGKLIKKWIIPDYPENGVGCFMINKKVKDQLNQNVESNSSLYFQLFTLGFKKIGLPYEPRERKGGKSRWTFSKKLKLFVDSFVAFSNVPSRFVTIMGAVLALVGIIWGLAIIVIKVFNIIPLNAGWPTLLALLLFGFGVTNLSVGIIAEYLWRTLDVARKRPVFIIDEEFYINNLKNEKEIKA